MREGRLTTQLELNPVSFRPRRWVTLSPIPDGLNVRYRIGSRMAAPMCVSRTVTDHPRTDIGTYELTRPGVSRLPRPLKIRAQVPLTRQQVDAFDRLLSLGLRDVSRSASLAFKDR